jgi:hypothetical protein
LQVKTLTLCIIWCCVPILATAAEMTLDGRSQEAFDRSTVSMMSALSDAQRQQLAMALVGLSFAGVDSAEELDADASYSPPIQELNGLTFEEVLEYAAAHSNVSVSISNGPPSDLPSQYLDPLPGAPTGPSGGLDLAGTHWLITSDINGHIRTTVLALLPGGAIHDYQFRNTNHSDDFWEQSGLAVRISLNGNYVVYLGAATQPYRMRGRAANRTGAEWTWTAEQLNPELPSPPTDESGTER